MIGAVADFLLAFAVIGIAWPALRGWQEERRASRLRDDEKQVALEDARTQYALAALQRPWVFLPALLGSLLKMLSMVAGILPTG